MSFRFLDPGLLIDRELQLVAPGEQWIGDTLKTCAHPLSKEDNRCISTTRESLLDFLKIAPGGLQLPDAYNRAPAYHFWMRLRPEFKPMVPMAGGCNLRIGDSADLRMYFGHIGYAVHPPARGHHIAARACKMLFPLAKRHGMRELWITCNPENIASRKTCETLGGKLIEVVSIPTDNVLYERGERLKCRYLFAL